MIVVRCFTVTNKAIDESLLLNVTTDVTSYGFVGIDKPFKIKGLA